MSQTTPTMTAMRQQGQTPPPPFAFSRVASRRRQRGSVYALVLGVAMLITVIGIGALATARVTSRAANVSNDWVEAGAIAYSAVEHAIAKLNADAAAAPTTWRNAYTDGAVAFSAAFGRGTLRWVVVDGRGFLADGTRSPSDDRVISDDYADDLTVYGIGKIGATTRVYGVRLNATGEPLDVLGCAVHTTGGVALTSPIYVSGGPLSTAGAYTTSVASNLRGGGGVQAGSARQMPAAGVFDTYKDRELATPIPSGAAGGGSISASTLADADGGVENPTGIYYLQLPPTISELTIRNARYNATLVIEAAPGNTSQAVAIEGRMLWEPRSPRYPILITRGIRRIRVDGDIDPVSSTVPSELRGLIHMIGGEEFQLRDAAYIKGCVLAEGKLTQNGGTSGIQLDTSLLANPPLGYAKGNKLTPAPGSWQWAAVPPGVN